ncbi:MAG: 4Fe-4S dicluster domain-containing protein [Fervidicoccaceae archaeon]
MSRVDPKLMEKVKKLGAFDVNACYSCGVCTAICPLSEGEEGFPRRLIRFAMLGMEDKLVGSPELWSCYYCGECTKSCPRQADPGGFMMAARRYAIVKYSWGRIASIFYSKIKAPFAMLALSLLIMFGIWAFHGSINTSSVNLFQFLPENYIHTGGVILGIFVALSALVNLRAMYKYIKRGRDISSASLFQWIKQFIEVLLREVLWESRYLKCENKLRFYAHMSLLWGFIILFAATGTDYIAGSRQTLAEILGFAGGILVMYGSSYFIYKRLQKKEEFVLNSDFIDWTFLILIFLAGLTGFLLDTFMYANMAFASYITFSAHLIAVFDLIVTAPFTKFAHGLYRPFALWMIGLSKSNKKTN